jgi:hypothetical protein
MNRVTLCLAYYENPTMLGRQLELLLSLPEDLRRQISLIVVDDGSPTAPAQEIMTGSRAFLPPDHGGLAGARLYRMGVDIAWNMDACRNLAAAEAETDWLLLTDMDHLIPEKTWRKALTADLKPGAVYKFARVSEPDLTPYKQHPNTWLLTRQIFDKAGGYDERFAGWYGTDGDFRNRVTAIAPVLNLKEPVIRVPREVTPDASTTTLTRRSEENAAALDRIKAERAKEKGWRPLRNRTPWSRVL